MNFSSLVSLSMSENEWAGEFDPHKLTELVLADSHRPGGKIDCERVSHHDRLGAAVRVAREEAEHAEPFLLSAPSRPEEGDQNDCPNYTPADPSNIWVSRLPFEEFLVDGHECDFRLAGLSEFGQIVELAFGTSEISD